jgi:hypothetical protein
MVLETPFYEREIEEEDLWISRLQYHDFDKCKWWKSLKRTVNSLSFEDIIDCFRYKHSKRGTNFVTSEIIERQQLVLFFRDQGFTEIEPYLKVLCRYRVLLYHRMGNLDYFSYNFKEEDNEFTPTCDPELFELELWIARSVSQECVQKLYEKIQEKRMERFLREKGLDGKPDIDGFIFKCECYETEGVCTKPENVKCEHYYCSIR